MMAGRWLESVVVVAVREVKVARRRRESQLGFVCAVAVAGWRDYVDVHAARALHFKSLKSSLGGEKLVE